MQYAKELLWISLLLIIHNTARAPNKIKTRTAATAAMIGARLVGQFVRSNVQNEETDCIDNNKRFKCRVTIVWQ
ncbi:hypothetical protein BT93_E0505 [Corymbia citriodora subsp. variegata]|nr:hypothetical protein BT93_E0505 [Corymbia citriodora subsp. variegata]